MEHDKIDGSYNIRVVVIVLIYPSPTVFLNVEESGKVRLGDSKIERLTQFSLLWNSLY